VPIEFYSVKERRRVSVPEANVRKVVYYPRGAGNPRYALRATYDGQTLTKFVSKAEFDRLDLPVEQA